MPPVASSTTATAPPAPTAAEPTSKPSSIVRVTVGASSAGARLPPGSGAGAATAAGASRAVAAMAPASERVRRVDGDIVTSSAGLNMTPAASASAVENRSSPG
jgi:hypothetical protein